MMKRLDYYAGYPNQQRTPKWVGVTLGSLFGGRSRSSRVASGHPHGDAGAPGGGEHGAEAPAAEAGRSSRPAKVAVATPAPETAPSKALADQSSSKHHRGSHAAKAKKGKHAVAIAVAKPASPKYQKAQMFAKHVSGNRRDKKARDDLDKLLGM